MAKIKAIVYSFIIWFAISGPAASAQPNIPPPAATPITIYTPNGSVVPNTYTVLEMTQAQIATCNNYVASTYPNATILSNASYTYNCHGYAWYMTQGGGTVWIGWTIPGSQAIFWNDGSYTSVSSCKNNGEKVRYSNADHSAVTTGTTDIFQSKWGYLPLMLHNKNYTPYNSTNLIYYIRTPTNTGSSLVCTASNFSINNLPVGSTLSWSSSNPSGLSINASTGVATRVNNYNGQVNISATVSGSCGSVPVPPLTVWVGAPGANIGTLIYPSGSRGIDPVALGPASTYLFQSDYVPQATSFRWLLPSGFSFYSGSTTSSPFITTSATAGSYTLFCAAVNSCGQSWTHSLGITISTGGGCCPAAAVRLSAFPNPASSTMTVTVADSLATGESGALDQPYRLALVDRMGSVAFSTRSDQCTLQIPVNNLPMGIYYLNLVYKEAVVRRQVIISR